MTNVVMMEKIISDDVTDISAEQEITAQLRVLEALIFAADTPLPLGKIQSTLDGLYGAGIDASVLLARLQQAYSTRGIELVTLAGGYAFRTALDLAPLLKGTAPQAAEVRKPPRAATETLAIVAYHQPVTRAEIEAIRGVQVSRGTLDLLMEAGWIRPGKRRETPGRPVTWLTTPLFLEQFGLGSLKDLPGMEELKAAGLLDSKPVLATLPAEPDFAGAASLAETREDNDFLPAGDEQDDDVRAPKDELTDEEWEQEIMAEDDERDEVPEADDEQEEDELDEEDFDEDEDDDDDDDDFDDEDDEDAELEEDTK